jgi:hypothetical protein
MLHELGRQLSVTNYRGIKVCPLKTKIKRNFIEIHSPYRAVNTLSVIKTSQLMLCREIIAVCSQIHTNTPCGQNVGLLNVKLAVHIVTAGRLGGYEHETRQQTCILLQYMESIVGIFTVF